LRGAFLEAAAANGALAKYGAHWADSTITRALRTGANDPLPPLNRKFRKLTERVIMRSSALYRSSANRPARGEPHHG
jgi:hypothetical protein